MRYFVYFFYLCLILSCSKCTNTPSQNESKEQSKQVEPKYLYHLNIDSLHILSDNVQNGESVGEILNTHNISFSAIDKVARLSKKLFDLRDVKAGGNYTLLFPDSTLSKPLYFIYEINKVDFLVAKLSDTIDVYLDKKKLTIKEKTGSGIIHSSLWYAMEESNLSAKLVNI